MLTHLTIQLLPYPVYGVNFPLGLLITQLIHIYGQAMRHRILFPQTEVCVSTLTLENCKNQGMSRIAYLDCFVIINTQRSDLQDQQKM